MTHSAVFWVISLLFIFFFAPCISSKRNSFTLKLIHRDSPLSPLYQPNISDLEHIKKHAQISESRSLFFQQLYEGEPENSKITKNATIRLPLNYDELLLTVELSFGTPTVRRTFVFDTGSHLTWTQCRPCVKCFRQNKPLFDPGKSSSYSRISKNDNLAKLFPCTFSGCYYNIKYMNQNSSWGIVSKENFMFKANNRLTYIAQLVFGCGTTNVGPIGTTGITGILGMNKHPVSFARQLGQHFRSRFSYCLPRLNTNIQASVLRFGEKAIIRTKSKKSLRFLPHIYSHYALFLIDISIAGKRVGLGPYAFPNDCGIDSGTGLSFIEQNAYSSVTESFDRYFLKFKNLKRVNTSGTVVCYSYTAGFNTFPNMTYHFQGADLNIRPENVVIDYRNSMYFCLSIMETRSFTMLGAYQQQNTRFVYDLDSDMLTFAREDCSKDVAA